MNINKIYKPIESFCVGIYDNTNQFVCLSEEVKDLEEKYKELLADKIEDMIAMESTAAVMETDFQYDNKNNLEMLKRHTGKTWEKIKEYNNEHTPTRGEINDII